MMLYKIQRRNNFASRHCYKFLPSKMKEMVKDDESGRRKRMTREEEEEEEKEKATNDIF